MPYVNIRVSRRGLADNQRLTLARRATEVMTNVLGKRRELVAVEIT